WTTVSGFESLPPSHFRIVPTVASRFPRVPSRGENLKNRKRASLSRRGLSADFLSLDSARLGVSPSPCDPCPRRSPRLSSLSQSLQSAHRQAAALALRFPGRPCTMLAIPATSSLGTYPTQCLVAESKETRFVE